MKTKNILAIILAVVMSLSAGVQAVTVTFHTAAPTPGPDDISNFVGAARDADNVGTVTYDGPDNDQWTYVALDRAAMGQTFVTGGSNPVYLLTGFWIRHVGYSENTLLTYYSMPVNGRFGIRITDPCASGTASFVLGSETYTITRSELNILPVDASSATGTGTWIHFVLDTPVVVEPNRMYGFDVVSMTGNPNMYFETHGIKDIAPGGNPYTAGIAYRSGASGAANNVLTVAPGDRVFVVELVAASPPEAFFPSPVNKATGVSQDPVLSWNAGFDSTGSKVYFGIDANNLGAAVATITHTPGVERYSCQRTGLAALRKYYYWRVDEVQQTDPDVTGNVWSFTTGTPKASEPNPYDNEICVFISPDPNLSWKAGSKSAQSKVYFGTSPGSLELKATIDHQQGVELYSYTVTGLVNDQDYYWEVNEVNGTSTWTGDVWHFKTIPIISITDANLVGWWKFDEGLGKAIDWSGLNQHGTVYGDAASVPGCDGGAIEFDYIDDYVSLPIGSTIASLNSTTIATWVNFPGTGEAQQRIFNFGYNDTTTYMMLTPLNNDGVPQFSITTTGSGGASNVTAPSALPSGWHHLAVTIDGSSSQMIMYIDGAPVINGDTTTLPSALGDTNDNWLGRSDDGWLPPDPYLNGSLDDFRIYNYAMSQAEIGKVMAPPTAWAPSPADGAPDAAPTLTLSWRPGVNAAKPPLKGHDLYFSDNWDAVNDANNLDPCGPGPEYVYKGRKDANSYGPISLEFDHTYYWRVDEVNDPNFWRGAIWSFTTADYHIVDDFESYANNTALRNVWKVGTTRAIVTLITDPNLVNTGSQSMQFRYSNGSSPFYSEAYANTTGTNSLPSGIGSDWSAAKLLTLYFKGKTANDPNEPMYVTLTDGSSPAHTAKVLYDGAPTDLKDELWHEWNITLQKFVDNNNVNLANVKKIAIGLGDKVSSYSWSSYLYFDDIRLYVPRCVPSKTLAGDIDNDCDADYNDLEFVVNNWLISDYNVTPVNPTDSDLVGWWKLDETSGAIAEDSVSDNDGNVIGTLMWIAGKVDGALQFNGVDDYVDLPIDSLISSLTNSTFATWVDFNSASAGAWQRIFDFGNDTDTYMFLTPRVGAVEEMRFAITTGSAGSEQQVSASATLASGWHHVAVTIDADNNTISLYLDGDFVNRNTAATLDPHNLGATTQNWLGRSQWGADAYFDGSLDDFRIYDRALSQGEVAWLADKTTEFAQPLYLLLTPTDPNIDVYDDGKINFKDYAVLANDWLKEQLYP